MNISSKPISKYILKDPKIIIKSVLLILVLALSVIFIYQIDQYLSKIKEIEDNAKEKIVKAKTLDAISQLDNEFSQLKDIAEDLAKKLSDKLNDSSITNQNEIDYLLKESIKEKLGSKSKFANAVGIAYKEGYGNLFSRILRRRKGDIITMRKGYEERPFFFEPIKERKGVWIEPHVGVESEDLIIAYSTPFYKKTSKGLQAEPIGVVFVNYSWNDIKEIMQEISLGNTGYGFILSQKEKAFIAHPLDEYIRNHIKVDNMKNDGSLKKAIKKSLNNNEKDKTEIIDFDNNGNEAWLLCDKIPSTQWTFGAVFIKNEIIDVKIVRRLLINIIICLIIFLTILNFLIFKIYIFNIKYIWRIAIITGVILAAGIGAIWFLSYTKQDNEISVAPMNNEKLGEILNDNKVTKIPVGLDIQSIEFSNANNVEIKGLIWEKINDESQTVKFITNDDKKIEECKIEFLDAVSEPFEFILRKNKYIYWSFKCKLSQNYNYKKYPLDSKMIRLRMIFKQNIEQNKVMLTPDMSSYMYTNSLSLPGINPHIVLAGMTPTRSYFEYNFDSSYFKTNDQIHDQTDDFPELDFTFFVQRSFLNPFISNLLPLLIIAGIIFTTLLMLTRKRVSRDLHGQLSTQLMASCGTMAFSVIMAHSQLRGSLIIKDIMYLDWFYFVIYIIILFTVIDAYLFWTRPESSWIVYENNIVAKLIFWPFLLASFFIVTLCVLY
ncbi:PDC sensor domain-containing protein [Pseudobacteroides cellulosolvens]|uniref:Cache domain containing protein n=1 Tax=Pseudobacteroides cellulosolvens ATCC 35603 = DSM 2933 TaxID=398512 RepID=A0A0L6JHL1_9FIRM|nr:Cache 3/Cache 2 fusion domain-containing protein [Pseudobacteroides cellulosolvens]KNY25346.1 Cache domain containing protein [Pseudobacteroides cellulosolvens ATCC 35603 = DSM 2933]